MGVHQVEVVPSVHGSDDDVRTVLGVGSWEPTENERKSWGCSRKRFSSRVQPAKRVMPVAGAVRFSKCRCGRAAGRGTPSATRHKRGPDGLTPARLGDRYIARAT